MARRFQRGFNRSRRAQFAKKRLAWTRALFGTDIDIGSSAALGEHILFDALTDIQPDTSDYHRKYTVKRIIVKGGHEFRPLATTFEQAFVRLNTCLYVIDREDTDASIVSTTPGEILEGGADRVLFTDVQTGMVSEVTTANRAESFVVGPRIEIDWRGNAKCGIDQLVVLGFQLALNISGAVSNWTPVFVSSVLFEMT